MLYSGDGSSNTGTGKERRDSGSAARGILSDGDLPTDSTLISFLWYFRNTVPMSLNPRPRAGGDGISFRPCNDHLLFQSTPPRRGRLPSGGVAAGPVEVSIHAPAQGATVFFYLLLFNEFSLSSARTICLFVLTDILFSKNILISPVISSCFILREHPWFSMSSTGSRAVR